MTGFDWVSEPATLAAMFTFLAKATLLLVLAEVATRALRGASAATRHLIWAVAIVGVLVLPLAAAITPAWSLGWMTVDDTSVEPIGSFSEPVPSDATSSGAAGHDAQPMPASAVQDDAARSGRSTPASAAGLFDGLALVDWLLIAVSVWLLGATILGARLGFGILAARRMVLSGDPASQRLQRMSAQVSESLGIQPVPVVLSDTADVPMAWGLLRSAVVMPRDAEDWSDERAHFVLVHELAHVRRSDCLSQMIAHVTCAVHWLNPMVWRAAAKLRAERELACDALVLRAGARGSDYAKHLLEIARCAGAQRAAYGVSLPMARPSQLEGRLLAILNSSRDRLDLGRGWLIAVPVVAALLIVPLAAAQPVTHVGAAAVLTGSEASTVQGVEGVPSGERTFSARDIERLVENLAPRIAQAVPEAIAGAAPAGMAAEIEQQFSEALTAAPQSDEPQSEATRARVVAAMQRALEDEDADIRMDAAHALGMMESAAGVPVLLGALEDSEVSVRKRAAWALGMIESAAAVDGIRAHLGNEPDDEVRSQLVWALGMIESAEGVPALEVAATDRNATIRKRTAWALGMIESARGVPALLTLLADSDDDVRSQAAWGLGMVESADGVDGLLVALGDGNTRVRRQAAWALGMIESDRAVDGLLQAMSGADVEENLQIIWALGMIESDGALNALLDAMEHEDRRVQRAAMSAVARITG